MIKYQYGTVLAVWSESHGTENTNTIEVTLSPFLVAYDENYDVPVAGKYDDLYSSEVEITFGGAVSKECAEEHVLAAVTALCQPNVVAAVVKAMQNYGEPIGVESP